MQVFPEIMRGCLQICAGPRDLPPIHGTQISALIPIDVGLQSALNVRAAGKGRLYGNQRRPIP
jgi:hypothetical protein